MSIAWRSGSSGSNSIGSTATVAAPAGLQPGDLIIATVVTDGVPFTGTGFTQQATGASPVLFNSVYLGIKVAGIGEPSSYVFNPSGAGSFCTVVLDAYYNEDRVSPMDVAVAVATGTPANVTFPDETTLADKARHYASFYTEGANSPTTPAGYAARTSGGSPLIIFGYDKEISPAGLVTGVHTTGGGNPAWVAFSTIIRPMTVTQTPTFAIPMYDELS